MLFLLLQSVLAVGFGLVLVSFISYRIRQLPLRNLPGPPVVSWLTGNYKQLYQVRGGVFLEHICRTYGKVVRVTGLLGDATLLVSDAKACNSILLKEQDMFEESHWLLQTSRRVFGPGLLATIGAHHRKQRKLLNPVFSIKHVRLLLPLFRNVTAQLEQALEDVVAEGPLEVDMMEGGLELIAQGGLGYTFNTSAPQIRGTNTALRSSGTYRQCRNSSRSAIFSPSFQNIFLEISCGDTMSAAAKGIFEEKKALLARGDAETVSQVGEGRDILSILMLANMAASKEDRLQVEEILG
ncbi:cytochrome P450 [Auriscalpium vulgare]|uniref:Cytochrome P450 n=1 Tax=Auriscalpium vulgare TaxID=40419 RepID=A0ACB8SBB7_9AGAM|nr:cytochrome P450 [Auriscalpium vulgare]